MKIGLYLSLLFAALSHCYCDTLAWAAEVKIADNDHLVIEYSCRNLSSKAVVIKNIKSDCNCTVVSKSIREIGSGATSHIVADQDRRKNSNVSNSKIIVELDNGEVYQLTMNNHLPLVTQADITISPEELLWSNTEAGKSKKVVVRTSLNNILGIQNITLSGTEYCLKDIGQQDANTFYVVIAHSGVYSSESNTLMIKLLAADKTSLQAIATLRTQK